MNNLYLTLSILGIVVLSISILLLMYHFTLARKKSVYISKMDHLIEGLTYKSELLNPTVETINKFAEYADKFEDYAKNNSNSLVDIITDNKASIIKFGESIKKQTKAKKTTKRKNVKGRK